MRLEMGQAGPADQRLRPKAMLLLGLALSVALALGSCARERARRQQAPYQIGGAACLQALAARGVRVEPWSASGTGACRVNTPVLARSGRTVVFSPPLETSCAMLVAWSDLEPVIQQAASEQLGSPVRAVRDFGSYSCRGINGDSDQPSLHATGRAIDVAGFELANGRVVTVLDGWRASRAERRFLRLVRDAACHRLGVVLGPASDRRHRDHLHIDIGPWQLCG